MSARGAIDDPLDGPPARDIAAAVDPMRAIVAIVPRRDGVAAFTQLYVAVTEAVERELEAAKAELSSGIVGGVGVALGTVDDVVAFVRRRAPVTPPG